MIVAKCIENNRDRNGKLISYCYECGSVIEWYVLTKWSLCGMLDVEDKDISYNVRVDSIHSMSDLYNLYRSFLLSYFIRFKDAWNTVITRFSAYFSVLIFHIFKKTIEFTLTLAWKSSESKPLRYYESNNSYV